VFRSSPTHIFYACFVVLVLIFPSQLALNRPWQITINVGVGLFISLGFLIALSHRRGFPRSMLPLLALLLALLFASFVSSFLNDWMRPLMAYGAFTGVTIIAVILSGSLSSPNGFVRMLVLVTVVSSLFLVAASLAIAPITLYRYQGIFNNSNSMGWFAAGVSTLVLGSLYGNRLNWSQLQRSFLWSVMVVHVLLVLACNSRSSLTAVVAVIAVFITLYLVDTISLTHMRLPALPKASKFVIVFAFICSYFYFAGILDPVIEKFMVKSAAGDVSDSRLAAWSASLEHWTWLGLGSNYAEAIGRRGEKVGHSIYISQLSQFGLIPTILFVTVLLYFWLRALYGTLNRITVAPTLLATLTGFLVNAGFETGASTPGMWLALLLFSALLAECRIERSTRKLSRRVSSTRVSGG